MNEEGMLMGHKPMGYSIIYQTFSESLTVFQALLQTLGVVFEVQGRHGVYIPVRETNNKQVIISQDDLNAMKK